MPEPTSSKDVLGARNQTKTIKARDHPQPSADDSDDAALDSLLQSTDTANPPNMQANDNDDAALDSLLQSTDTAHPPKPQTDDRDDAALNSLLQTSDVFQPKADDNDDASLDSLLQTTDVADVDGVSCSHDQFAVPPPTTTTSATNDTVDSLTQETGTGRPGVDQDNVLDMLLQDPTTEQTESAGLGDDDLDALLNM